MTNEGLDGRNLEEYIPSTIGSSTHRKLTEKDGLKIDLPNARAATQEMRRRLDVVFHDFSDVSFQTINWDSPDLIRTSYVNSLTNTPDGETIDKSKALEQYLQVNTKNHSGAIKEMIEASYEPLSIPRTFVNLMNYYEDSLSVTGQDAAIMTLRLLIEYLPLISVLAEAKGKNISELDASRDAFRSIESLMPSHIEEIQAIQKTMKINANKAQAFALRKIGGKDKGTQSSKLTLLSHEKDGLVEAIHIQDRPYSKDELVLASRVLKENKYVGSTLIAFQQLLIQYSWNYFRIHPDRLAQNLEPFNPIFLPVRGESGNIISLSPNPKLLKTMCNNWLPSIAREIIRDNSNIATGDVDTDIITAGQINNGIANTDNYYIFTSILGEFVATNNPTIFELRSSFSQICPAKNMFIESGKMIIPDIYVYLERLNKE